MIGGRWWEGANGGGIKAPSKPFSKLLQKSRVLLQAFPKKSLAVLWDFKGLQGFQTSFDVFQIFPPSAAPFRPHFGRRRTAFRRLARSPSGGPPDFTMQFGRRRVHRGAAIQIERIFNLTDNSISGKKYPLILPSPFHTNLRPVPWDETGLPLFRTRRPPADEQGFTTSLFQYQVYIGKSMR